MRTSSAIEVVYVEWTVREVWWDRGTRNGRCSIFCSSLKLTCAMNEVRWKHRSANTSNCFWLTTSVRLFWVGHVTARTSNVPNCTKSKKQNNGFTTERGLKSVFVFRGFQDYVEHDLSCSRSIQKPFFFFSNVRKSITAFINVFKCGIFDNRHVDNSVIRRIIVKYV